LPSMCEALSLIHSTEEKIKKKNRILEITGKTLYVFTNFSFLIFQSCGWTTLGI
jgi:hypothetical protein